MAQKLGRKKYIPICSTEEQSRVIISYFFKKKIFMPMIVKTYYT